MIYAEVADPTYTLDTPLAGTVSYMRTEGSIENYQKLASGSGQSLSNNNDNKSSKVDQTPGNPSKPPNRPDLDSPSHPALSLNSLRLHPLAETTLQVRREYISAYFATPTFTLPIAICALSAPHHQTGICSTTTHEDPLTIHYHPRAAHLRAAYFLDSSRLNDKPALRHQHFKVTALADYNDTTSRPLHSLRPRGRTNKSTVRVEWEGFVDVVFAKGRLSVEGRLVRPVAGDTARGREATVARAEEAFGGLKADLKRACGRGRNRMTNRWVPWGGYGEDEEEVTQCPPNSPVLAAVPRARG